MDWDPNPHPKIIRRPRESFTSSPRAAASLWAGVRSGGGAKSWTSRKDVELEEEEDHVLLLGEGRGLLLLLLKKKKNGPT